MKKLSKRATNPKKRNPYYDDTALYELQTYLDSKIESNGKDAYIYFIIKDVIQSDSDITYDTSKTKILSYLNRFRKVFDNLIEKMDY